MPHAFMRAKAKEALGKDLPPQGEYAVGNIFFPPENPDALKDCKAILERLTRQRGLEVLGWRPVPVDNSMLGQDPLDSEPDTEQVRILPWFDSRWTNPAPLPVECVLPRIKSPRSLISPIPLLLFDPALHR